MARHISSIQRWWYPEFKHCPPGRPTRSEWRSITTKVKSDTEIQTYWVIIGGLAAIVVVALLIPSGLWQGVGVGLVIGAMNTVAVALRRSQMRTALRAFLATLGTRLCLSCGYNITGIDCPTCPECGRPTTA